MPEPIEVTEPDEYGLFDLVYNLNDLSFPGDSGASYLFLCYSPVQPLSYLCSATINGGYLYDDNLGGETFSVATVDYNDYKIVLQLQTDEDYSSLSFYYTIFTMEGI